MAADKTALLVSDVDNTVFDWVGYYTRAITALFETVARITKLPVPQLATEARDVFSRHGSIEYPFLIQELPSVEAWAKHDIDRLLREVVEPGRKAFLAEAERGLVPYVDVPETLKKLREKFPRTPLVALTDAPRYVAMWKLNKLGLLDSFDAVYGLPDPRIPTSTVHGRVKVDPEILLKHLQQSNFGFEGKIRILPEEYEKPGTRGLKTVLMDFDLDENPADRRRVVWVGDNLRKDVALGQKLGVRTVWARYGVVQDPELFKTLHTFSPVENIHKNASIDQSVSGAPQPDVTLECFADILDVLRG
jgi:FMN phosphatase YigB (HAD superfamily)